MNWLTLKEASEYLKVSPRTLAEWVRRGQVKAYPLSGCKRHVWRFLQSDLDESLGFVIQSDGHPAVLHQ